MEGGELESVVQVLSEGKERVDQLERKLRGANKSGEDGCFALLAAVSSSIDGALEKLRWMGAAGNDATSHVSVPNDLGSVDSHQVQQVSDKKRKPIRTWTVHLTGTEALNQDEYQWRKYGQKNIQDAKHPRAYYRCSKSKSHNCPAKKFVQQTEDNPVVVTIKYLGDHVCVQQKAKKPKQNPTFSEERQDELQLDPLRELPYHYPTTATESVPFETQILEDVAGESYSTLSNANPCLESGFTGSYNSPRPHDAIHFEYIDMDLEMSQYPTFC